MSQLLNRCSLQEAHFLEPSFLCTSTLCYLVVPLTCFSQEISDPCKCHFGTCICIYVEVQVLVPSQAFQYAETMSILSIQASDHDC